MPKYNFKIGDKVKVVRIDTVLYWKNGPKLINQIGVVSKMGIGLFPIEVELGAEKLKSLLGDNYGGNTHYYFNKSELEHIVKVGEQLMFSFMKG